MANSEVETGKKPEMVEPAQESNGQYLLGYCDAGVSNVGPHEDEVHCNEDSLMLYEVQESIKLCFMLSLQGKESLCNNCIL